MDSARTRIFEATVDILKQPESRGKVTMRAIAKKAGVGVGLINYHFRSKEALIRAAVRAFVGGIIGQWQGKYQADPAHPDRTLEQMLTATMDFCTSYQRLSRISMEYDYASPEEGDNTDQTVMGIVSEMQAAGKKGSDGRGVWLRGAMLVALLQSFFLRKNVFMKRIGIDLENKKDRDWLISALISAIDWQGGK